MEYIKKEELDVTENPVQDGLQPIEEVMLPVKMVDGDPISELVTDEIEVKDEHDITTENILWCTLCNSETSHTNGQLQNVTHLIKDNTFKCLICGTPAIMNVKSLMSDCTNIKEENLNNHIHEIGKPPECFTCGCKTFTENILQNHDDKKPYNYVHCHYSSTGKDSLNHFIGTSEDRELLECFICGYKTLCKGRLRNHVKIHKSEKLHKCTHCDYRSTIKDYLNKHMVTHGIGERFECFTCGFKTFRKNSLQKHLNIHGKEKVYKCSVCDYNCARKEYLNTHMATHRVGKCFQCFMCGYKAFRKDHLLRHLNTHSKGKSYKCIFCDYCSTRKDNLNKHMRLHYVKKV